MESIDRETVIYPAFKKKARYTQLSQSHPRKINPSNGNSTHLVDESRDHWPNHWTKEWRDAVNRHWTGGNGEQSVSCHHRATIRFLVIRRSGGGGNVCSLPDFRRREEVTDGTSSHGEECGTKETGYETEDDENS